MLKADFIKEGQTLKACLEKHPDYRTTSRVLRKAFGALRRLGAINSAMVLAHNPLRIKAIADSRPVSAFVYEGGTWKLDGQRRQSLMPDSSDEMTLEALNSD